jgi:hypothetical protein
MGTGTINTDCNQGISYVNLARESDATHAYVDEALILHSKVLKLERPARRTREVVQGWFFGTGQRRGEEDIGSARQVKYSGENLFKNEGDLVSLHPPAEEDRVSRSASRKMGWLLKVCAHCCT